MARRRRKGPSPRQHKSKQKKYGGGKFLSERQRRFMWATSPRAAHKWAHNRSTNKSDWSKTKARARARARSRKRRSTSRRRRKSRRR